ncbi:MAG: DUF503 domain-containing protein [Thermoleophilaceae bacterium]
MRNHPRELHGREGGRCDRGVREGPGRAHARELSYLVVIEIQLHFPDNRSLKGKRKELLSLKSQLHKRFGATVAETDHHDLWQRSTLTAALVGRDAGPLAAAADNLERYVLSQFPETVMFQRGVITAKEVIGE